MKYNINTTVIFLILGIALIYQGCDKNEIKRTEYENFIIDIAYDKDYEYPDNFYHESIDSGFTYYENTVSTTEISNDHVWIELSTNDREQAFVWSELSNEFCSVNREIISEVETEKYFEFTRQNSEFENDLMYSRIHKLNYFEPTHNKFLEPDTIGIYNGALHLTNVKELVEYLWDCFSLGINDSKVIESSILESTNGFEHYIQSIQVVHGDFNINDVIYIYDNYFRVDKSDRYLIIERNKIKTIEVN